MSYSTAHEHVRVARVLEGLPETRAAFGDGKLSYSKVRAITRAATVDSEAELCELALAATAVQIEAICAGYRQAKLGGGCSEKEQAATAHRSRRLTRRDNHDGSATITIVLPTVDANACENARDPDSDSTSVPARIEVTVDLDQLSGTDVEDGHTGSADGSTCETGGTRIAPEVARCLGCDAQISTLSEDSARNPLSVGRETQIVPRWIRRALNQRDHNRCQFLGCDATRSLHAHHIVHWANGGPTELTNLVLVCNFHHHLLHEHGWNVEANSSGGHNWITPNGETATIRVFRGRHSDLPQHTDPDLIHKLSGDTLQDLSWITTALIHNETNSKAHRTT